jgi:tetratricopeptide (TPR) repeat protein
MDNNLLLDTLLSGSPRLLLAGAAMLILALIAARSRRRGARSPSRRVGNASAPPPEAPTPTGLGPVTKDLGSLSTIEVREVDPLAEVEIYLQFGYLERAADTLRSYADSVGQSDREGLRRLLELYRRLGRIDDYAEILERLCTAGEGEVFAREAVLAGLAADPDNLPLRVVAETRLGLGVEQVNALIGYDAGAEPTPAEQGKSLEAAPPTAASQLGPAPTSDPEAPRPILPLISGEAPLASLSEEEKAVLRAFAPPGQAARLHLATHDLDEAVAALRQAIALQPKALSHFTDILKIFHARRQIDEYARTLWHLYCVLDGCGRPLRERLLGSGFALGRHPVFEALSKAKERRHLDAIGRHFGFLTEEPAPPKRLRLIDTFGQPDNTFADPVTDALREAESYLDFGQIEEALAILEAAVLENPLASRLYPPLLDLYDRMDALPRLAALAAEVKRRVRRPPEEVVPMMTGLYQRLKQRKEKIAA